MQHRHSIDDVVRAINDGLPVYDAGRALLVHEGGLNIRKSMQRAAARSDEAA
jgi:hypothetical protein